MAAGERDSPLAAFLRAEVPDWDDEVVSRARYKGFTGQRADWENRLQFWKDLVVKCARQLGLVIIEPCKVLDFNFSVSACQFADEPGFFCEFAELLYLFVVFQVQHQWFLREGITPLGISTVLVWRLLFIEDRGF